MEFGRWHLATAKMRKYDCVERTIFPFIESSRSLGSNDRDPRALRIGLAQRLYPENLF
jgi:hypothetical protein